MYRPTISERSPTWWPVRAAISRGLNPREAKWVAAPRRILYVEYPGNRCWIHCRSWRYGDHVFWFIKFTSLSAFHSGVTVRNLEKFLCPCRSDLKMGRRIRTPSTVFSATAQRRSACLDADIQSSKIVSLSRFGAPRRTCFICVTENEGAWRCDPLGCLRVRAFCATKRWESSKSASRAFSIDLRIFVYPAAVDGAKSLAHAATR